MSRMLQDFPEHFQRLSTAVGGSTQHECDMRAVPPCIRLSPGMTAGFFLSATMVTTFATQLWPNRSQRRRPLCSPQEQPSASKKPGSVENGPHVQSFVGPSTRAIPPRNPWSSLSLSLWRLRRVTPHRPAPAAPARPPGSCALVLRTTAGVASRHRSSGFPCKGNVALSFNRPRT
jgi:hypothetical protein